MSVAIITVGAVALGLAIRPRTKRHRVDVTALRRRSPPTDWDVFLDQVAAGVRAGRSLRESFADTCALRAGHDEAIETGTRLQDVPGLVSNDADETVAIQTLSVALALGGPVATVLHSGAVLLRERAAVRAEAAVHAAQARLSARVLTAVPLVFAGWGLIASPSFRTSLIGPFGLVAATVGVLLNLAGWWWMRRIVLRATT